MYPGLQMQVPNVTSPEEGNTSAHFPCSEHRLGHEEDFTRTVTEVVLYSHGTGTTFRTDFGDFVSENDSDDVGSKVEVVMCEIMSLRSK